MSKLRTAMAEEAQRVSDTLYFWQAYEPAVRVDLSCCAVRSADGWILIDPIPLAREGMEEILELAKPACIILTNGNHARAAEHYRQALSVPVLAHEEAAAELGIPVDRFLKEGDVICGGVAVVELTGAGTGEIALVSPCGLHLGDALINLEPTGLMQLPDKYCSDAKNLRRNLRKLLKVEFTLMTFAHGLPLLNAPGERLVQLLA